jgi:hypothetical protein
MFTTAGDTFLTSGAKEPEAANAPDTPRDEESMKSVIRDSFKTRGMNNLLIPLLKQCS